jgi:hypothetical protein
MEKSGEILLYKSDNWDIKINVFFKNETIWLSQKQMWELFDCTKENIIWHLKNIFKEWEVSQKSVTKDFLVTASDWKKYKTKFYNLDAIIAVWYRVNSYKATQFRIWSNKVLQDFIIKWFVMDDERLKNWNNFWKDYFKELLERVRSIRTSERRIYLQITDIFAECSIDYNPLSQTTKNFYATIQNKFHFAITGNTAAEIIYDRVDKDKINMWLQTWKNSPNWRILKTDTNIAKNYLEEKEIKKLERTIWAYFDYIENQIEQQNKLTMESLSKSVNLFLEFNKFKILDWNWNISKIEAEEKAFSEYNEFNKTQKINSDFEKFSRDVLKK